MVCHIGSVRLSGVTAGTPPEKTATQSRVTPKRTQQAPTLQTFVHRRDNQVPSFNYVWTATAHLPKALRFCLWVGYHSVALAS
jgi:hypothetical protein